MANIIVSEHHAYTLHEDVRARLLQSLPTPRSAETVLSSVDLRTLNRNGFDLKPGATIGDMNEVAEKLISPN